MTLLLEVLGAMAAGAMLGSFVGHGRALVAGITSVGVGVSAVAAFSGLWFDAHGLIFAHDQNAALSQQQSNTLAGGLFPADEPFLAFADANIPRTAKVYLYCGPRLAACSGGLNEWITFRLTPRVFVPDVRQARYALFYGADPRSPEAAFARGWRLVAFSSKEAVASAP